jgi:hypothetical protein
MADDISKRIPGFIEHARWQPKTESSERDAGLAAWHRAVDRTFDLADTERDPVEA